MAKKIKLTRSIIVNGRHGEAGSVVETDDYAAVELINSGKAVEVVAEPEKKVAPPPAAKRKPLSKKSAGKGK